MWIEYNPLNSREDIGKDKSIILWNHWMNALIKKLN